MDRVDTVAGPAAGDPRAGGPVPGFRHEAFLYEDDEAFAAGVIAFVRDALDAEEPVMVALEPKKIALLRGQLAAEESERVRFVDMHVVGENPARIIPAWRDFVDECSEAGAGRVRGIGEPIWPGRTDDEIAECHCHESLLNVAFAGDGGFWLLCPYDTRGLAPEVVAAARRTHPFVVEEGVQQESAGYDVAATPLAASLPDPAVAPETMVCTLGNLRDVRAFVLARAIEAGLSRARAEDLLLATNEVATNSIRHGGGSGLVRVWRTDETFVCEVRDGGFIADALVGRTRPEIGQIGGYGMWMVNRLCELVQIRSTPQGGSIVRMHVRL